MRVLIFLLALVVCCNSQTIQTRRLSESVHQIVNKQSQLYEWFLMVSSEECEDKLKKLLEIQPFSNPTKAVVGKNCFIKFQANDSDEKSIEAHLGGVNIEPNAIIKQNAIPWHLDRIDQASPVLDGSVFKSKFNGGGVDVYILDTGIRKTHEQLTGRVVDGENFSTDQTLDDLDGHGTHCASDCCGRDFGVASGATIINVKVLNSEGSGSSFGLIQSFQWILDNKSTTKPSIVSMSLAGPYSSSMNTAILDLAANKDILVFVAAGNENMNVELYSPASAGEPVITVGATDSLDNRASFSNFGDKVNVWAPGVAILGAINTSDTATAYYSGTSMATPIAAGVAATFAQKYSGNITETKAFVFDNSVKNIVQDAGNLVDNFLVQVDTQSPTKVPTQAPTWNASKPTPLQTQRPTGTPSKPPTLIPTASPSKVGESSAGGIQDVTSLLGDINTIQTVAAISAVSLLLSGCGIVYRSATNPSSTKRVYKPLN